MVVQLNVRGTDLGRFVASAQRAIRERVKLGEGYSISWGGQFENLQKASARLLVVVPMAVTSGVPPEVAEIWKVDVPLVATM